ncbi:MAG: transglutaminase family protein [Rhodobacteraceae bacterium]|jgi:transglutaminase-like putative cysteine protease|uniref:Transglutaminase-like enzyme, predicted cysteine protease n=1 Tax=Salipiger profundus TaxID=1229727 RepID=A0A1U7D0J4_9RHOB|nr:MULTISPECIES: transglutaminase family protein [Salipiger]APX21652.1 transglutaminase-like enzyme, predicted cysteine protease [Salipiger profundus]MAB08306.1 transglutaminase family protein [Paracoccaceae bacterium]GGA00861.1 transglutaminase [Salipiger profundus]
MRLSVRHTTRYRFDHPVRGVAQSLRLWPADCASQKVVSWQVRTEGALRGAEFTDGAGDRTMLATWRGPLDELTVEVSGEVETADLFGVLREHREKGPASLYLRSTKHIRPDHDLKELSVSALDGMRGASDLDRAHALAKAVNEAIEYAPGETQPHTTAAEALAGGRGVCQDHAHALIAVAHVAGIPARYVMGYLQTDGDGAPHEASHAWAELFVPNLGWVGFDAANRCCPDDRYIRLGSGYDAQDAAPIRGVVQGSTPDEHLEVEVVVTPDQQQQ